MQSETQHYDRVGEMETQVEELTELNDRLVEEKTLLIMTASETIDLLRGHIRNLGRRVMRYESKERST